MTDESAVDGKLDRPDDANDDGGETVPTVDLDLYQLSVSVTGRSDDELGDVEDTARRLMEYLVGQSAHLEEHPDDRGLG